MKRYIVSRARDETARMDTFLWEYGQVFAGPLLQRGKGTTHVGRCWVSIIVDNSARRITLPAIATVSRNSLRPRDYRIRRIPISASRLCDLTLQPSHFPTFLACLRGSAPFVAETCRETLFQLYRRQHRVASPRPSVNNVTRVLRALLAEEAARFAPKNGFIKLVDRIERS